MKEQNLSTNELKEEFKKWILGYDKYKPSAKKACLKAIEKVDQICIKNDLGSIYKWSINNWENLQGELMTLQEMISNSKRVTPPGSGWYSASVTKYK